MSNRNLLNSDMWYNTIQNVYGFIPYYFKANDGSVLKMSHIKFPFFKNDLVSGPYISNSDPIINSSQGFNDIIRKVEYFAKKNRIDVVEIKSSIPLKLNWKLVLDYVTFRIPIYKGADHVFENIHRKVRTAIRKGIKNELYYKIGHKYIKIFYNIYSKSVKRLGTPVHRIKFYQELINNNDNLNFMIIFNREDIPISTVMFGIDEDAIYPLVGGGLQEYNGLSHNNFKYWKLIEYACNKGCKLFDFGRSTKNTGTYFFKKRWYAEEVQLYYYYLLKKEKKILNVSSSEYKFFSKYWSKLPLKFTQVAGPTIRKYIY